MAIEVRFWPRTSFAARQQYGRNRRRSGSGWQALKTSLMTRSRRSCNAVFFDCSLATAQFVINRITYSPVGEVIDTVVIGAG